jgi:excisionase family DNA binding protein
MQTVRGRSGTPHELAELLNLSPNTVYRLIKAGQIRAVRVGQQFRIPAAEIDRLTGGDEHPAVEA